MLTIGIDIGTTNICGVLYDVEMGSVIESKTVEHHALQDGGNVFSYVMDADRLIHISQQVYEELLEAAHHKLQGICVTGQMHGIVYLDDSGNVISPLYTWMDMRGNQPKTDNESYAEYYTRLTGYSLRSGYGALTHLYNVENNLVPEDTYKLCTIMDLFTIRLCNKMIPVTDPSNAASLGLYDMEKGVFDTQFAKLFPDVQETGSIVGYTNEGIPVFNSIGDNQAGTYWALQMQEDAFLLNIGTSGQVSALTDTAETKCFAPELEMRPYMKEKFLLVGAMLNGGNVYQQLEKFFREVLTVFHSPSKGELYDIMNEILEANPQSGNGLVADTRLLGTRTEPDVKGSITNITLQNFNVASFLNAFAEGIIREGYEMYLKIPPMVREKHREIVVAGNLLKRSTAFRKRVGLMFGLPVRMMNTSEEAAAGAAKLAADCKQE